MLAHQDVKGAYASFAEPKGVALYGSAMALRTIADALGKGAVELALDSPPPDAIEAGPVRSLRLLGAERGPVILRARDKSLEIDGGSVERGLLAQTLRNLSSSPQVAGPVPTHVDLEYFPEHGFLDEASMWMTVILVRDPAD